MPIRPHDGEFPHIEIERHPDAPERRRKQFFPTRVPPPNDRGKHAVNLTDQTTSAIDETVQHRGSLGIDPSRLVVLEFTTLNYDTHDDFSQRFQAQVVDESVYEEGEQTRVRTVVQFPNEAAFTAFRN